MLLDGDDVEAVLSSIDTFEAFARWSQQSDQPPAFAGVHSLDAQRFYDLLCMAYGSDPEGFDYLVGQGNLPADRAAGVPGSGSRRPVRRK